MTLVCRRRRWRLCRVLTWLAAFNDPGTGTAPPVIFMTSRAVHTHLDSWKRIKYYGRGVEPGGNRSPSSRTANEDIAFRALWGRRQDRVKRVMHFANMRVPLAVLQDP